MPIKNNVHYVADVYAHLINHNNHKNWVIFILFHNLWLISVALKHTKKNECLNWKSKIVYLKNLILHIHQFSILKKIQNLAHENLVNWMAGRWLNLSGCQAVLKKVILVLKKISLNMPFFRTAWQPFFKSLYILSPISTLGFVSSYTITVIKVSLPYHRGLSTLKK